MVEVKIIKQLTTVWQYRMKNDDTQDYFMAKVLANIDGVECVTFLCIPAVAFQSKPYPVASNPFLLNARISGVSLLEKDFHCVGEKSVDIDKVTNIFKLLSDEISYEINEDDFMMGKTWIVLDKILKHQ